MLINFLSASLPLTKSYSLNTQNELQKSPYPMVSRFTSHTENVGSLLDLYKTLKEHSTQGHCLLKGNLERNLEDESRAGATRSDEETEWLLIDLDSAPFKSPEDFMQAHSILKDISYVVQYSASYGVVDTPLLSCHLFILLDKPIKAPSIKPWLMSLNLYNNNTRSAIRLSRTGTCLHWPVDLTTCQNDKLIYIAPPVLSKGVKSKIKETERIQLVAKKNKILSTQLLGTLNDKPINPEALKAESRKLLNELREGAGYEKLRNSTKWVGEYEVQSKPGAAVITGIRRERGFTYFNLNGGDSWAYYHPENNYTLIHDFKNPGVSYETKELLPDYYRECLADQKAVNASPVESGDVLLAFRDFQSGNYYNGTWNEETYQLNLARAKDTTQLDHFLQGYDRWLGDFVPVWRMEFAPDKDYVLDEENKRINTFVPTEYLRAQHEKPKDWHKECPLIYKTIMSAVSGNEDNEILEFFLNWLAVIYQHRIKTTTAWVLTGTEGTGKGVLVEHILQPTMGPEYVAIKRATELEEHYTGWMEKSIFCYIDEIQVGSSTRAASISSNLRNWITERSLTIRNMHSNAFKASNYSNFILSSNKPDPVVIEDNDRRYNFGVYQLVRLYLSRKEIYEGIPAELNSFMNYIMTRSANIDLASSIMQSTTRQNVIESSRTSLEEISLAILNGDLITLWNSMPDLNLQAELHGADSVGATAYAELIKREIKLCYQYRSEPVPYSQRYQAYNPDPGMTQVQSKLSRDELFIIYDYCIGNMPRSPNKFSSLLRHRNIQIEPIRFNGKLARGIYTTWRVNIEQLTEIHSEVETPVPSKVTSIKKAKIA